MGLWLLLSTGLLVWAGVFVAVATVVFIVAMFRTGRRSPDPHGVLLPAAFAGSLTFTGLAGVLGCVAWLGVTLGAAAGGASGTMCAAEIVRGGVGTSSGRVVPLAQEDPGPGPPPFQPLPPSRPTFTPPPIPTPPGVEPPPPVIELSPRVPYEKIPLPDDGDRDGSPLRSCESPARRMVVATLPWLTVSAGALGGGSRMFTKMLTEERSHDRA